VVCPDLHLEDVAINPETGDYDLTQLQKEEIRADTSKAVADEVVKVVREERRKTVVFTTSVNQAQRVDAWLREAGVSAAWISGEPHMALDRRRSLLAAFDQGEIDVLSNCQTIAEGWNSPAVSCVVMAAPTCSKGTYVQKAGRALRTDPKTNKEDCLILDLVGAQDAHGLVTASVLEDDADTDLSLDRHRDPILHVLGAKRDGEFGAVLGFVKANQQGVKPVDKRRRARAKWLTVIENRVLALSAGEHGSLVMVREPGDVDLWMGFRVPKDAWGFNEARRIMPRPAPIEFATGVVEDRARKLGVFGLAKESAGWRKNPPSEGQAKLLAEWGLPIPATKGAKVRMIGMKRAMMMVLPPYFS